MLTYAQGCKAQFWQGSGGNPSEPQVRFLFSSTIFYSTDNYLHTDYMYRMEQEPQQHKELVRHCNNRNNCHHQGGNGDDSGSQSAPGMMPTGGPMRRPATGLSNITYQSLS